MIFVGLIYFDGVKVCIPSGINKSLGFVFIFSGIIITYTIV
jgi:hypothetical protein